MSSSVIACTSTSLPRASRSWEGAASIGGSAEPILAREQLALLWTLNQSDGDRSLLDIAERSGIAFADIADAAQDLVDAGLLIEPAASSDETRSEDVRRDCPGDPGMRVLVTGHHGYIGSITAPLLAQAGHDVVGLDTFFYSGCDFGADGEPVPFIAADVRDVTPSQLGGFEAVVHLAALSNDPLGDLNSEWTYEINLDGTLALARAAKEAGVERFVFASSCSMYGAVAGDDLLGEDAPLRPLTPYAESKVRAEEALHELADSSFSPVFMRNATAFGASPRLRLDVVLNNLAAWAHTTGRIRLMSDGSAWRPLVHVRDISRATLALLEAPRALVHGQAFNVGSANQNVRISDLANTLNELLQCEVEMSTDATPDPRSYRVDFGKLERALPDFRCEWTAELGAEELVGAYQAVGLSYHEFQEAGRYTRLAQLKRLLAEDRIDDGLRWRDGDHARS